MWARFLWWLSEHHLFVFKLIVGKLLIYSLPSQVPLVGHFFQEGFVQAQVDSSAKRRPGHYTGVTGQIRHQICPSPSLATGSCTIRSTDTLHEDGAASLHRGARSQLFFSLFTTNTTSAPALTHPSNILCEWERLTCALSIERWVSPLPHAYPILLYVESSFLLLFSSSCFCHRDIFESTKRTHHIQLFSAFNYFFIIFIYSKCVFFSFHI